MHCQAAMHPCCHLPGQPSRGDAGTLAHSGLGHQHPFIHGMAEVLSLLASPEGWGLVWVTLLAASPRYQVPAPGTSPGSPTSQLHQLHDFVSWCSMGSMGGLKKGPLQQSTGDVLDLSWMWLGIQSCCMHNQGNTEAQSCGTVP